MTVYPKIEWPKKYNEVPKEVFVRPDLFALEKEKIFFGTEWHAIAHESEIPEKGDFKAVSHAGVPLLVSRGVDGKVRVFFNSCPHRGNEVESAPWGRKTAFECPYHRWVFSTTGKLKGCPSQREYAPDFSRDDYGLRGPRVEIFLGLIFITFSEDTEPLDDYLGEVKSTLAKAMGGDGRLKLIGYQKVRYNTNWKVYGDNDSFHGPLLHKALNMLSWQANNGTMNTTTRRGHVYIETNIIPPPDDGTLSDISIVQTKSGQQACSYAVIFYPTFVITKHIDVINLRFATPLGVDQTQVSYAYFAHADDDEEQFRQRVRQGSNLLGPCGFISMEDAAIFHRTHIGNHTPGNAVFQKGVKAFDTITTDYAMNDETHALIHWEYYRELMGFERSAT